MYDKITITLALPDMVRVINGMKKGVESVLASGVPFSQSEYQQGYVAALANLEREYDNARLHNQLPEGIQKLIEKIDQYCPVV